LYLRKSILTVLVFVMTIFCSQKGVFAEVLISPALSINGSYDSNPFLRGVGEDIDEDYVFTVSPEIGVSREGRSLELNALYRADAILYSHEPLFNYIAHSADLGAGLDISPKTSFSVDDHFSFTKDSLIAFGEGIQTERSSIIANTASAGIDHELGEGTTLSASFSDSIYRFGVDTLVDTRSDSADISLSRTLKPGRTVSASYTYAVYAFDAPGGSSTTETHSMNAAYTTELARDFSLDLSVGAVYTPERSGDADLTAKAGLTKSFRDSTVSLGYQRGVTSAQGLAQEISISDMGYLSATHRSLAASLDYTRFVQWVDGGVANDLKRDQAGINLRFTPEKWRL
jgi:hypothetical protein